MVAELTPEEMDILTSIMDGGDKAAADKTGVSLKFLSNATQIEENKLKPILKKLISDGYVEHRFFSDNTDDYVLREKGAETVNNL